MTLWNTMRALAKHIQSEPDAIDASLIERELQGVAIDTDNRPAYAARIGKLIKIFRYEGRGRNPLNEIHTAIKRFEHDKLAFLLNQYAPEDFEWTRQNFPIDSAMTVEDKLPFINTAILHENLLAVKWLEIVHMAYEYSKYPDVEYPDMAMFIRIVGRHDGNYINVRFKKYDSLGKDDNHVITPAMACLEQKKDEELQWLLAHPKFCPEENTNNNQTSLLHWAVRFGDPRHVKWCLDKFDVNVVNNKRKTPLFMAAKCGHIKKLKMLLKAGADPSIRAMVYIDNGYQTPFIAAAAAGHLNMVKRLPKKHMYYALGEAIINKHVPVVKWLLKNGAPLTSHKESCASDFVLYRAMRSCPKIKQILWESGAGAVVSTKHMEKWSYFEPRTFQWSERCCMCFNDNTFPVRLICGHISCGKCMQGLISYTQQQNEMKTSVSCPECRKNSSVVEIMSHKSVEHSLANISKVEEASTLYVDKIRTYKHKAREMAQSVAAAQVFLNTLRIRHLELKERAEVYQRKHDAAVKEARAEMARIL